METVMTQIPDERLVELADLYHTPLYVFEEAVIRSRCRELKAAITYPRTIIRYACKALSLQAILRIISGEGLWIDASSLNEVLRSLRAGFLPEEIYYTGEGATLAVYGELVQRGVLINCTSMDQIRLLGRVPGSTVCSMVCSLQACTFLVSLHSAPCSAPTTEVPIHPAMLLKPIESFR